MWFSGHKLLQMYRPTKIYFKFVNSLTLPMRFLRSPGAGISLSLFYYVDARRFETTC